MIAAIVFVVILYVVADAFFDVSHKLSRKFGGLKLPALPALSLPSLAGGIWLKLGAIAAVPLFTWGVVSFIEGKGALREQAKEARVDAQVAQREAHVAQTATSLAEHTHHVERDVAAAVALAQQDIAHAVSSNDLDTLYVQYRRSYDGLWDDLPPAGRPDPAPGRSRPVHPPCGADA